MRHLRHSSNKDVSEVESFEISRELHEGVTVTASDSLRHGINRQDMSDDRKRHSQEERHGETELLTKKRKFL
jgi:hypothetical protein